ncbi:MAG: FAD-binding oxidoreductase [Cyanobacteria bacterium J06600_6]
MRETSTENMTTAIATKLESITDIELIKLDNANLDATNHNWHQLSQAVDNDTPIYLVFPQTREALSDVVKQAAENHWRILICGNATKIAWGKITNNIQLVVSMQKCDRLIEHAVGDLTVTAEAGMKLVDLQAQLRSHNQFLPIDTNYDDATLGGIVATADTGSWRQRYGGVRDLLLGLSFVRADGEVAKAGGRVVKNVAGYDLMKLFTGSYGTLSIMTQLTFRTYPLITNSQTLIIYGAAAAIGQATQSIRNSGLTPTAMDLLSSTVMSKLNLGQSLGLMLRWQTIPESIIQQLAQVKAIVQQLDLSSSIYQDEAETKLWQDCTNMIHTLHSSTAITCKIGIAPAAAANLLAQMEKDSILARIHASTGIGQLQLDKDQQTVQALRAHCQQNQGFLTILNAPPKVKAEIDVWGYAGNGIKTMQSLKNQFDPQNILNPGRFIV